LAIPDESILVDRPSAAPPLVSAIIPTFRRADFLPRAIESVLAQRYRPVEVIVVEDGSRAAEDVVARYGDQVRYVWQENQGPSVARNRGATVARGSWLAFLDDDDFWLPERLELQMALVRDCPSLGFIHGNYFWFRNGARESRPESGIRSVPSGWVTQELVLNRFSVATSTTLVRRDAFWRIGGFDPAYRVVQDYDLWVRLSLVCQFGYLATPLACYQADAEESSAVQRQKALALADILEAFVAKNRQVCRRWPQGRLRRCLHNVHLRAAQVHLWADDLGIARAQFLKAWAWAPWRAATLGYALACTTGPKGVGALRALVRRAPR
jgi:glycosyltransferase involved in cell wall biosynthesis